MTRLTVYLLGDVGDPSDALDSSKSCFEVPIAEGSGIDGAFYAVSKPARPPKWVSFVRPALEEDIAQVKSASASGLLVLKAAGRYFGVTFGYGRSLLDQSKIEHRFGLRVALNRIDPRQIRSLDTKTFEDLVVSRTTQASKSAEIPNFGVDISTDILRAVTGEPTDDRLAKRLSGADALVLNVDTRVTELTSLCERLLEAYAEETYKANFGWIDHLALVEDRSVSVALDQLLVEQLQQGDTSASHLAMPETLDWADVDVFRIQGTRSAHYDDLDLDRYLRELGPAKAEITIDLLKGRGVSVRFARSDDFDQRWTLYKCLVTEQRINGRLYVLIEGRWFAVSDSLVDDVNQFTTLLSASELELLASHSGEVEAEYNSRLASARPAERLLVDAKIKRPGGAASGIELCDVLTSRGEFVHVKRKSRSATLSHLFAQGMVSASTFVGDGVFRDQIRDVVADLVPAEERDRWLALVPPSGEVVRAADYRISYVVVANSSRSGTDWLPFFSKLNLMQNGKRLINMGFSVSLSRVDVDDQPEQ